MRSTLDWDGLDALKFADEQACFADLLARPPLTRAARAKIQGDAEHLIREARGAAPDHGVVENFLKEFSLGTREGLALMCLAEALLRTPDRANRDRLIAEKVASADWAGHINHSDSLFVNAATWGLMLTGKLVDVDDQARSDLGGFLHRLAARIGEPVIRQAVAGAVRIMGEQFVLGRTIEEALARADREDLLCSFDMLGEGARTDADAEGYAARYAHAIDLVGRADRARSIDERHGLSVKLSALSPRFEATQEARVWSEVFPRLRNFAIRAARAGVQLAVDAEEADRLVLTLKLVDRLARDEALAGWQGLGVVVQAYQKRAPAVIGKLADLATQTRRRLTVRLVKGAYWDTEIKAAQVSGMPDYPVFTTKAATDVSYLVCARALLAASPWLFPQFATHNAHTLSAVRHMAAEQGVTIEHQKLQGMGSAIYTAAAATHGPLRVRTYAPVGGHEELLPYLVRRLLENGANSSFVHVLLDDGVPVERVAPDPIAIASAHPDRHPRIPPPAGIYGPGRRNPVGRDPSQAAVRQAAGEHAARLADATLAAGPIIDGALLGGTAKRAVSPADLNRTIGQVTSASPEHIALAVHAARHAQPSWDRIGGKARGDVLRSMGDALESRMDALVALLAAEAGKTFIDSVAEVREAIDFCRYYALLAEQQFGAPRTLAGPVGESNRLELFGRGTFACISPWNFPLAIFTGQIVAALAAGNAAIAKPAEQTPLIASEAVRLFHAAGLPAGLLHLLPGDGATIGAALIEHPGIDGVAFTGGTETAWDINRRLAARRGPIIPFIAETGGLNAMFVDTTALREQVIDDVLTSAFGSSGQRCSALRLLFLPQESADSLLESLRGALATKVVGDPADPATDIGPVIDQDALAALHRHLARLEREARIVARHPGGPARGHFFAPVIAEVDRPDFLECEVFGPVLHVCRYEARQLPEFAARLAALGYGLTLGIHSRIEQFAREVQALVPAGNVYVNRSMIGAVVGVQPFGGVGLSGTGPKAGGPHALLRFANERAISVNIMAQGGDPELLSL